MQSKSLTSEAVEDALLEVAHALHRRRDNGYNCDVDDALYVVAETIRELFEYPRKEQASWWVKHWASGEDLHGLVNPGSSTRTPT